MRKSGREPDNKSKWTLSLIEDWTGLVIRYDWIINAFHSKHSLGGSRLQERTWSAESELERCCQEGPTTNETHLWRSCEVAALHRQEWHWNVVQCVHMDAGWIKVIVKGITPVDRMSCVGGHSWSLFERQRNALQTVQTYTCL